MHSMPLGRSDMRPLLPRHDAPDCLARHAVSVCKFAKRLAATKRAHLDGLRCGQSVRAAPSLGMTVTLVGAVVAHEKVPRVHARAVIAVVADHAPGRNFAAHQGVSNAVGLPPRPAKPELPISAGRDAPTPEPAVASAAAPIDLRPEPVIGRLHESQCNTKRHPPCTMGYPAGDRQRG